MWRTGRSFSRNPLRLKIHRRHHHRRPLSQRPPRAGRRTRSGLRQTGAMATGMQAGMVTETLAGTAMEMPAGTAMATLARTGTVRRPIRATAIPAGTATQAATATDRRPMRGMVTATAIPAALRRATHARWAMGIRATATTATAARRAMPAARTCSRHRRRHLLLQPALATATCRPATPAPKAMATLAAEITGTAAGRATRTRRRHRHLRRPN